MDRESVEGKEHKGARVEGMMCEGVVGLQVGKCKRMSGRRARTAHLLSGRRMPEGERGSGLQRVQAAGEGEERRGVHAS